MSQEHRLVLDVAAAKYLGFARKEAASMRLIGLEYASRTYQIGDAHVSIRIVGEHTYIRLEGGAPKYQFFTTGKDATHQATPLPLAPNAEVRQGYVVQIEADRQDDTKTKAHSIASSVEESPEKEWAYYPVASQIDKNLKTGFQIQAYQENTWFRGNGTKMSGSKVFSSWGSTSPLQGISMRGGLGTIYSVFTNPVTDILYDIAPKRGASVEVPDSDWYRQAATQVVNSEEYGSRTFIIMVSVDGMIHAYPAGEDDDTIIKNPDYVGQGIKTNVDNKFVQRVSYAFPDWAAKPEVDSRDYWNAGAKTLRHYYGLVPQYKWMFNSTGKKVCAVVYERLNNAKGKLFSGVVSPMKFTVPGTTDKVLVQEALPGLIELNLNITLTGKEPHEFTFGVEPGVTLRPTVDKRYIMAADYAWEVQKPAVEPVVEDAPIEYWAKVDDLIILTGSIYTTTDKRKTAGKYYYPHNHRSTAEVYNLTSDTSIRKFLMFNTNGLYEATELPYAADLPAGEKRKNATCVILAMDLRVLAFVLQQKYVEYETAWDVGNTLSDDTAGGKQVQRTQVYMRNVLEDERYLDFDATAMNAALDAQFANTDAGTKLWPLTEIGTWEGGGSGSAFENMGILTQFDGFAATTYLAVRQVASPPDVSFTFDAGAFLYARYLAPLVRCDAQNKFVVHPKKSWALAMRPIFYHAGPAVDGDLNSVDVTKFKQTLLDFISFRTKGGKEIKTTHLAEFNKAFKKTVTVTDHLYSFSKLQTGTSTFRKYVKATTPAGGVLIFVAAVNGDPFPLKLAEFDANYPNFGVVVGKSPTETYQPTMPVIADTYYSLRPLGDSWAMLGGSACFY